MTGEMLLTEFDRVCDTPEAVDRLRRFLLDLAVRGRLAEQIATERPASELIRPVRPAQSRRDPARTRDRQSVASPTLASPGSWEYLRLVDIADVSYGFAFESSRFSSDQVGLPLIRIRDISHSHTEAYYDGCFDPRYLVNTGDYLVGMDGNFHLREWCGPTGLLNQRVMRICNWSDGVDARYIAIPLQMILNELHTGTSQTTVKHLSARQVNSIYLPVPPLPEQRRIVAKVDELMALSDRLVTAVSERERQRDRLTTATVERVRSTDRGDLTRADAEFARRNIDRLFARQDQLAAARETILELAVQGRLIPNQERGGYADREVSKEVLRDNLRDEDDLPFSIPPAWRWVSLGAVTTLINGDRSKNYPNKDEYVPNGVPWINAGHINPDGTLSVERMTYITRGKYEALKSGKTTPQDLVYCLRGTLGKTGIVEFEEGAIASSLVIIRANSELADPRFIRSYLISPTGRSLIRRFDNGSAQPNLAANSVKLYPTPLPPLDEQRRIVQRVNDLMTVCDQLEASLGAVRSGRARLLEAVLREALARPRDVRMLA